MNRPARMRDLGPDGLGPKPTPPEPPRPRITMADYVIPFLAAGIGFVIYLIVQACAR